MTDAEQTDDLCSNIYFKFPFQPVGTEIAVTFAQNSQFHFVVLLQHHVRDYYYYYYYY